MPTLKSCEKADFKRWLEGRGGNPKDSRYRLSSNHDELTYAPESEYSEFLGRGEE